MSFWDDPRTNGKITPVTSEKLLSALVQMNNLVWGESFHQIFLTHLSYTSCCTIYIYFKVQIFKPLCVSLLLLTTWGRMCRSVVLTNRATDNERGWSSTPSNTTLSHQSCILLCLTPTAGTWTFLWHASALHAYCGQKRYYYHIFWTISRALFSCLAGPATYIWKRLIY